ncbi:MAG: HAD family phosphatase [Clostridia bacterium]|nr:HAD family phosphatase [Clostridia bacterium]
MKIIGSDYDGTLNHGGIGEDKLTAIKKWQAAGNKFGVISGRHHIFLQELAGRTGIECDFLIAYNGGMAFTPDGMLISEELCTDVPPMEIASDLFDWGCPFVNMCSRKFYRMRRDSANMDPGDVLTKDVPALDCFYQVSVQLEDEAAAAEMVKRIAAKYGDKLTPLQNGTCIDTVPKGMNKAVGLDRVRAYYGAAHDDVIAVGDNLNDADMIRAFRSYAMESGAETLKEMATYTTTGIVELIMREL